MLPFYIINWSASSTASVFQYAGYLFSDFNDLLAIIIGAGIFIIIVGVLIEAFRRH